jgi:hypothetical protein
LQKIRNLLEIGKSISDTDSLATSELDRARKEEVEDRIRDAASELTNTWLRIGRSAEKAGLSKGEDPRVQYAYIEEPKLAQIILKHPKSSMA